MDRPIRARSSSLRGRRALARAQRLAAARRRSAARHRARRRRARRSSRAEPDALADDAAATLSRSDRAAPGGVPVAYLTGTAGILVAAAQGHSRRARAAARNRDPGRARARAPAARPRSVPCSIWAPAAARSPSPSPPSGPLARVDRRRRLAGRARRRPRQRARSGAAATPPGGWAPGSTPCRASASTWSSPTRLTSRHGDPALAALRAEPALALVARTRPGLDALAAIIASAPRAS